MASSATRRQRQLAPLVDGPGLPWALEGNSNPLVVADPTDPTNPKYTKRYCHEVAVAVSNLCQSYDYTLTYEDAMCIVTNPRYFNREDLSKREALDGFYYQKLYNALALKSPPKVEPVIDLKRKMADLELEAQELREQIAQKHNEAEEERRLQGRKPRKDPKYEATRDDKARDDACDRDGDKCVWQETPNQEMAHLFSFAATKTPEAVVKTMKCFSMVKYALGRVFFKSYLPYVSKLGGLEYLWNLLGLNVQLHTWLDMGFLGFRFLLNSQRQAGDKWYATIVFYWLPYCPPPPQTDRFTPAILDGGANDSVGHLYQHLRRAETNQYPPRLPAKGDGVYKLFYQDGHEILSGHSVEIAHKTKEARDSLINMIYAQWFMMKGLTFWGVTKGRALPLASGSGSGSGGGNGGSGTRPKLAPISTSTALTVVTRPPGSATARSPVGPFQTGPSLRSQRSTDPSPTTPTSGPSFTISRSSRMPGGPAPQPPPQPSGARRDGAQRGRGGGGGGGDPQRGRGGGGGGGDPQRGRGGAQRGTGR